MDGGALQIVAVALTPTTLQPGELLSVTIQVRNDSSETVQTMGPDPGFVYEEGESFDSRGFPAVTGMFRVGIDFDGRAAQSIDHPYRWGLGAPLAPGQTATVSGAIRLKNARTASYWAGLVHEWIAWQQDMVGTQAIRVGSVGAPTIAAVNLAPTALKIGDLLNVSITVRNDSSDPLPTQGPDPGFVYDEGDTFDTRGFADEGGNFRVGVDFTSRSGIDHPYRWGFGSPLAAGESRVITGSIRMKTVQAQDYWAGLVQEHIAWRQDRLGLERIAVTLPTTGNRPRVVHVHSIAATTWNGQSDYWVFVNQNVVNDMVDRGLMLLTGAASMADAWRLLIPQYRAGQGIAIKVNFTNSGIQKRLDASIQTINAIIRGLDEIGVRHEDIWVTDPIRELPERFVSMCQYPGIQFFDTGKHIKGTFDSGDPTSFISFSPPSDLPALPQIKVTDVLVNATYVINVPIFKAHLDSAGVTLGFKNHMGSTNLPIAFHDYIFPGQGHFRTDYNPLVDLYRNPNVGRKTVLTVGDGLFTGSSWDSMPLPMKIFDEKTPNSIFLSTDPVAIDSVMKDLLAAEWSFPAETDNYLQLASNAGLGMFERGSPLGNGYNTIDYQRIEV